MPGRVVSAETAASRSAARQFLLDTGFCGLSQSGLALFGRGDGDQVHLGLAQLFDDGLQPPERAAYTAGVQ